MVFPYLRAKHVPRVWLMLAQLFSKLRRLHYHKACHDTYD